MFIPPELRSRSAPLEPKPVFAFTLVRLKKRQRTGDSRTQCAFPAPNLSQIVWTFSPTKNVTALETYRRGV